MDRAKRYLLANFEHLFVLVTLLSTLVVNYLVPAKLAFLNFYFLPIILAGYYLGRRTAVLGALLCALAALLAHLGRLSAQDVRDGDAEALGVGKGVHEAA